MEQKINNTNYIPTSEIQADIEAMFPSDEPVVGAIFEAHFPGFDGYHVLVRVIPNKMYIVVGMDAETMENIITTPGIRLDSDDVSFRNGYKYAKIIVHDNCCGLYEWLPADSKVVGKITNLEKIQSILDKAANFPA